MKKDLQTCLTYYSKALKNYVGCRGVTNKYFYPDSLEYAWESFERYMKIKFPNVENINELIDEYGKMVQYNFENWLLFTGFTNSIKKLHVFSPVKNPTTKEDVILTEEANLANLIKFLYAVKCGMKRSDFDPKNIKSESSLKQRELLMAALTVLMIILQKTLKADELTKKYIQKH